MKFYKVLLVGASLGFAGCAHTEMNREVATEKTKFEFSLAQLDQTRSCSTPQTRKIAENTLKWFSAYRAENLKAQLDLFSSDFIMYHSVLYDSALKSEKYNGTLPADDPKRVKLPFMSGFVNKANYVDTLVIIAHLADQSASGDVPAKITCLNGSTVVVDVNFEGYQVSRDTNSGCITHRAPYAAKATKVFIFDPKTSLITRHYVNFDPVVSSQAKADLAKMQTEPFLEPVENTCRSFKALTEQYQKSANPVN